MNLSMFHISTDPLFVLFTSWYIHAEVKALACSRNQSEPEWEHRLSRTIAFSPDVDEIHRPSFRVWSFIKNVPMFWLFSGCKGPTPNPPPRICTYCNPVQNQQNAHFSTKYETSAILIRVIRHSALKITTGQRSLTVVKAFVTAEKLYQTVKMTATTKI